MWFQFHVYARKLISQLFWELQMYVLRRQWHRLYSQVVFSNQPHSFPQLFITHITVQGCSGNVLVSHPFLNGANNLVYFHSYQSGASSVLFAWLRSCKYWGPVLSALGTSTKKLVNAKWAVALCKRLRMQAGSYLFLCQPASLLQQ